MGRLEGRLAVVTGASRGIGEAITAAFAREGATVVMASRKQAGLDAAAVAIAEQVPGARLDPRALHVGRIDDIGPWWDAVVEAHGVPSILVNNAGTNPYFGPMIGTERGAWHKTFEVNLEGPFEMTRQLVSRHLGAGGSEASVISVASILGQRAAPLQGVYGMTKAALISMTQTLAVELGQTGIRLNAIAPGIVDTRLAGALTADKAILAELTKATPLHRIARPGEIAGLAVYLASDESSFVTGQTFTVDGGLTINSVAI